MNIRRGLLRLWLLGSIAWISVVAFHTYSIWTPGISLWTAYQEPVRQPDPPTAMEGFTQIEREPPTGRSYSTEDVRWAREEITRFRVRGIVRSHLEWGLGPPLAILVVGAALGWAFAGFRGTRRGDTPYRGVDWPSRGIPSRAARSRSSPVGLDPSLIASPGSAP